jgi:spermidine synthase
VESRPPRARILALSVVVVATSGMVYELGLATLASYILGNAVMQFSLTLGVYLSAMGAGTLASGFMTGGLTRRFILVESLVAVVGGSSAALLFFASTRSGLFRPLFYGEVFSVGALVGVELPLLLRLLKEELGFDESVVRAMTFDYAGSLVASLLFPLVLMPALGLVRTAALAGVVNAAVAWFGARLLSGTTRRAWWVSGVPVAAGALLSVLFVYGDAVVRLTAD